MSSCHHFNWIAIQSRMIRLIKHMTDDIVTYTIAHMVRSSQDTLDAHQCITTPLILCVTS